MDLVYKAFAAMCCTRFLKLVHIVFPLVLELSIYHNPMLHLDSLILKRIQWLMGYPLHRFQSFSFTTFQFIFIFFGFFLKFLIWTWCSWLKDISQVIAYGLIKGNKFIVMLKKFW